MHRASIGCPFTSTTFIVKGAHLEHSFLVGHQTTMKSFIRQALPLQQKDDCMSVMSEYVSRLQGRGGAL